MSKRHVSTKTFKELVQQTWGDDLIVCRAEPFEADAGEQTPRGYVRTFVISTDAIDREGDRIMVDGWNLDNYRRGGTVLYAHNHRGLPVGTPEETWIEPGKLKQRIRFTTRDEGEFGYSIGKLVEANVLKAASVGFQAIEWKFVDDRPGFQPVDFIMQELLENSIVPVPANPEALAEAKGLGIAEPVAKGLEELLDCDIVVVERDILEAGWKAVRPARTTVDLGVAVKSAISYNTAHANGTPLAPEGTAWDGPRETAAADVDDLKIMCTWVDKENAENKTAYKLPHHKADEHACVWNGVKAAMGALLGGRGGVDIPEADRRGVFDHLKKHYAEFEKEAPEFRSTEQIEREADRAEIAALAARIEALEWRLEDEVDAIEIEDPVDEVDDVIEFDDLEDVKEALSDSVDRFVTEQFRRLSGQLD